MRIGAKNVSGSGGGERPLIGVANPGPVEDRADEEDRVVARFELAQPRRHPVDSIGALAGNGRRNRVKQRRRKEPRAHPLECVGSGKVPVTATNRGVSRSMNSRAIRSPRAVRKAAITPWQGSIGT